MTTLITLSHHSINSTLDSDYCPAAEYCSAKTWCWELFESHLQNSSTDVSGAGLTFHPKLGMIICFAVWHSISATDKKPNNVNLSDTILPEVVVWLGVKGEKRCGNIKVIWGLMHTYLLMYSPVKTMLQVWHLKQLTCHCFSRARRDWPCVISSPHPAQSKEDSTRTQKNGIKEREAKQAFCYSISLKSYC